MIDGTRPHTITASIQPSPLCQWPSSRLCRRIVVAVVPKDRIKIVKVTCW